MFSHYFIPHMPFVFTENGYFNNSDSFNENHDNYYEQLKYADILFGEIMQKMKDYGAYDISNIVLMSDHNYRKMYDGEEKYRVPLIIKKQHQKKRRDFYEKVGSEAVLWGMVQEERASSSEKGVHIK